jgi:MoxR-like ATPase
VKVLATAVLEHRLLMSSEAMMRGVNPADALSQILDSVPVPATRTD